MLTIYLTGVIAFIILAMTAASWDTIRGIERNFQDDVRYIAKLCWLSWFSVLIFLYVWIIYDPNDEDYDE